MQSQGSQGQAEGQGEVAMKAGHWRDQEGGALAGWDPPEDDMAQGIEAPPARPARHLAELQGVEEDVVPSKGNCAAGHVDTVCQCACTTCAAHQKFWLP